MIRIMEIELDNKELTNPWATYNLTNEIVCSWEQRQNVTAITEPRFRINVSRESYRNKSDALACLKKSTAGAIGRAVMAFDEKDVTVTEFLRYAVNGYSFCNLYLNDAKKQYPLGKLGKPQSPVHTRGSNKGALKLSMKCNQYFKGAQVIFIDVDETCAPTIFDYVNALTWKPTCTYPSYSDGMVKDGKVSRRFHMVYVFDSIMSREDFLRIAKRLTRQIEIDTHEPMADKCGERESQYMNGCYMMTDTMNTGVFFSVNMFPWMPEESLYYSIKKDAEEDSIPFNSFMLADMEKQDYATFTHSYSKRYGYIYRTEKPDWLEYNGIWYQMTDEDYLALWHYPQKITDGDHRRNKMALRCCLRRLMKPGITPDELIYQLYIDRERYFDNSDGVLDVETMKRKVENAMRLTPDELQEACSGIIEYWKDNRPQFILHPDTQEPEISRRFIARELNYQWLDAAYDTDLSLQENLPNLYVSRATVYRYWKDRNGCSKKEYNLRIFKENYDPNLTNKENIERLKNRGLSISERTMKRYKNSIYNNK